MGSLLAPPLGETPLTIAQGTRSAGHSTLDKKDICLAIKFHTYLRFYKLHLMEALFIICSGPLVNPATVLGAKAIDDGGEEDGIPG